MLFVPRQVSLAAAMPEKKTTATAKSAAAFDTASLVVCSIAAFLESHGFSRALAALQAEANLEDGSWRSSSPVSLEELFAKFLDSSNCAPGAGIAGNGEKENTANNGAEDSPKKKKKKGGAEVDETESKVSRPSSTEEPNGHGHAAEVPQDETKEKKKKKKKKDGVEAHEPESKASEPSALENTGEDANGETKEEKKKAGLSAGNAGNGQANGSINAGEDGKKKKGKKQEKDEDVGAEKHKKDRKNSAEETESCKESQSQNDAAEKNGLGEDAPQDKGKKKKKGKSTSEKPCSGISNEIDAANSADEARLEPHGAKEKSNAVEIGKVENEKKSKKKRKKSGSEENFMGEDKEISGKGSLAKSDHGNMSETEIAKAENRRPEGENAAVGKKRKLEEVEGSNTPTKEDGTTNQKLNNGFAEDDAKEKSIVSKPSKRQKHSSEPQTVNTFQRVKLEDVKFADERLQDNSYWAKGGADSGYGAKAQEVLGQVRGRDFRHEKTKKKRGSYRGGLIDLQTHSIKFNYSDDE